MNNPIFSSIEFTKEIPKKDARIKIKNIFDYHHAPSDEIKSLDQYYDSFRKKEKIIAKTITVDEKNINTIYAIITYPLTNSAVVKFVCNKPITHGILLYAYTIAYQLVYKTEDDDVGKKTEDIPGMLNRAKSNGRFGISGHLITDLAYNGISSITIHDNYIVCYFDCDS